MNRLIETKIKALKTLVTNECRKLKTYFFERKQWKLINILMNKQNVVNVVSGVRIGDELETDQLKIINEFNGS